MTAVSDAPLKNPAVTVIGGGLAGSEAALVLAGRGITVRLIDRKPGSMTPAHSDKRLGELVCSNSLKSDDPATAGGLLKAELRLLKSPLIALADTCRVPAGSALAVDRDMFAQRVTDAVDAAPYILRESAYAEDWDTDAYTVIATGPLTDGGLLKKLTARAGKALHFYDAAAPILSGACIDRSRCFTADRYGKGTGDYLNCPMTKEEYRVFYEALVSAKRAELKAFERSEIFEGCMPIEVMAARGYDTLRFGPMRPVGFVYPDGKRPAAVAQLRRENAAGDMYNLVGFQTNLTYPEQRRVFSLIPALGDIEILRYGVMHRNSYLSAPDALDACSRLKACPKTWVAGQLSGVEGYVESILSGHLAARHLVDTIEGRTPVPLPEVCLSGALPRYLAAPNPHFRPMNANFGILPPLEKRVRDKRANQQQYAQRSLSKLKVVLNVLT